MTQIYLAQSTDINAQRTLARMDWAKLDIGVLTSFHYLPSFEKSTNGAAAISKAPYRMLDSGAFSAWNVSKKIDIEALILESRNPRWHESVALDVIGDAEASMRNALYMRAKGSPAFPVFHYGDPWEMLQEYKRAFPKVGLSCLFGEPRTKSLAWVGQCFARAWPHCFHSFGWTSSKVLERFPFHSADSSSWATRATVYGHWKAFGNERLSVRVPAMRQIPDALLAQVEHFARFQMKLRALWRKELSQWTTPNQSNATSDAKSTPRHASST